MLDGTLLHSEQMPLPKGAVSMARRALTHEDARRFESVTLHAITYASSGLRIKGFLALPPGGESAYPAIVFNRGGSGPRGALTAETAMPLAGLYASWGYVVVASNYRGTGGSEGAHEEWGAGDVDDSLALLPLLDSLSYVDHKRIGLIGGSRGGMMAYMMLTRTTRFSAAVTFGAPSRINAVDQSAYIRKTMMKHIPVGSVEQDEADRRSAVLWADKMSANTPLLLLHGTNDVKVDPEHSLYLALELQRLKRLYKLVMYDSADHVLAGRRKESNADIQWWMDRYVKVGINHVGNAK